MRTHKHTQTGFCTWTLPLPWMIFRGQINNEVTRGAREEKRINTGRDMMKCIVHVVAWHSSLHLVTSFHHVSFLSLSLSASFSFPPFLPISGKNSNYISESAEALVNDWKRGERGSGQPNKIQWAESLYCHRVCVSGRQEERNNLCPSLVFFSPSFLSFLSFD